MLMTAEKTMQAIQARAEEIKRGNPQRFPEAASVGDTFRQGDVYFTLLAKRPNGCTLVANPSLQLAPGTTQGSRHCLDSIDGVKVYALSSPEMLDGPILVLKKERTVTHPEHGHAILPAGCYRVTYQRDLDEEERIRRVQD